VRDVKQATSAAAAPPPLPPDDLRDMPAVLTSREAARVLRVGVREVRLLVDSGQLAGARVGPRKVMRISKLAVLSLLKVREAI
jgi:excisionase family DNA binding protein